MKKRKQLLSYLDAKPATHQHKSPCSDCPFTRTALKKWLGDLTPEEWIGLAHGEGTSECHVHSGVSCAGLAIYRANVCKRPRDKTALELPRNTQKVFASPTEFLNHHS